MTDITRETALYIDGRWVPGGGAALDELAAGRGVRTVLRPEGGVR